MGGFLGSILGPLLGIGGSVAGGILSQGAQNARNDLIAQWAQQLFNQSQFGVNKADFPYSLAGQLFGNLAGQQGGLTPQLQDLLTSIQGQQSNLPGLFNNQTIDPATQQRLSDFLFTQGNIQSAQNPLQQLENNGGQTADNEALFQRALTPMDGTANLLSQGKSLVDNAGMNPFLALIQQAAGGILQNGGFTDPLESGINSASNVVANNGLLVPGMTNSLNALTQLMGVGSAAAPALESILASGGNTPTTQALASRGLQLFNQPSLLPMNEAASFARDQAGTANLQAAKQALAQATARNAEGSVNTGGDQALKDASDAASRNTASAVQNALLNQQGLQLQQAGLGANAATGAGQLVNQLLNIGAGGLTSLTGIGAGGLGNLTGIASNNVIQALKTISDLTQAATGRLSVGGSLGLGSQNAATQNLNSGGSLLSTALSSMLGGENLGLNTLGLQQQGLLGSGSVLNNLFGTENQSTLDALNGYLQNAGLNLNRGANLSNALQGLFGLQGNIGTAGLQGYLNAASGLSGIGQGYLGYGSNSLGGIAGLIGSYGGGSPIGNVLLNGGLGTLASLPYAHGSNGIGQIDNTISTTPAP